MTEMHFDSERQAQFEKGDQMVRTAKNWQQYWNGIDYVIASIGFDTDEEYEELEVLLDERYGHTLCV